MTTFAHPAHGEALDITAVLRLALAAPSPARPPGDSVPIRASYWPRWSANLPGTVSYCDDRHDAPGAHVAPPTEVDWSLEEIERAERLVADRERARRGALHNSAHNRSPFRRP